MERNTMNLFARYNTETNRKMNDVIRNLTDDEWKQEFKGYFNSIKSLCNHVYIADFTWLKRFSLHKAFNYIQNPIFETEIAFTDVVCDTKDEYLEKRPNLDHCLEDFVAELTDHDLEANLVYKNSRGDEFSKNLGGLILHMFNHQTHHRGMISLYLEELGKENDYSNLFHLL